MSDMRTGQSTDDTRDRLQKFTRITDIINLLSSPAGYTCHDLEEALNISTGEVMDSLSMLIQAGITVTIADAGKEQKTVDLWANDPVSDAAISPGVLRSLPADTRFTIYNGISREICLFLADQTESDLFMNIQSGSTSYHFKPIPAYGLDVSPYSEESHDFQDLLYAMRNNLYVEIDSYVGLRQKIQFIPRGLIYYSADNLYYFLNFTEDGMIRPLRFDRIRKMHLLRHKKGEPLSPDDPRLQRVKYYFGNTIPPTAEQPIHVKVAFQKRSIENMPNLYTKIISDLRYRIENKTACLKTDDPAYPDDLIYEDDIIGISSFRRWVLSYGSAAVVLEPASLSREIWQLCRKRLHLLTEHTP